MSLFRRTRQNEAPTGLGSRLRGNDRKRTADVFGIPIESLSLLEIIQKIETVNNPLWIVTTNPEILLEARRDTAYAQTLRQADLRIVDGFGLWLIGRLFGQRWSRVTGVELAEKLIQFAAEKHWRVALLGGYKNVAQLSVEKWKKMYPDLSLSAESGGYVTNEGMDDERGEEARHRLTLFAPDVLFVAFGHPKQERWIARYLADFPTVKVVVGVGGTLDYWAKRIPRAPRFMSKLGFEWLWRLIIEPRRIKRILRAVIIFPILAIIDPCIGTKEK